MKYSELLENERKKDFDTLLETGSVIYITKNDVAPHSVQFTSNWHTKEALGIAIYELIELYKSMP